MDRIYSYEEIAERQKQGQVGMAFEIDKAKALDAGVDVSNLLISSHSDKEMIIRELELSGAVDFYFIYPQLN